MGKEQYKDWKRGVVHDVLEYILRPLVAHMEDGVNLLCPDGNRRHCFPVLAQYVADYEEQRLLASILQGFCPKCVIPAFRKNDSESMGPGRGNIPQSLEEEDQEFLVDASILQHSHGPRENDDAQRLRRVHKDDPKTLRRFGYHGTIPFTERHVFTSIYDALAPDLLHQVSKCFYDYVHQWVLAIIGDQTPDALRKRKRTNTTGTKPSKRKTRGEIDARFSQLPPYPGLRSFREGISLTS